MNLTPQQYDFLTGFNQLINDFQMTWPEEYDLMEKSVIVRALILIGLSIISFVTGWKLWQYITTPRGVPLDSYMFKWMCIAVWAILIFATLSLFDQCIALYYMDYTIILEFLKD